MGAAVTFVMAIASVVVYLLQYCVLVPLRIEYMQTIAFILVIAALVQMVEIILKKVSPSLYQALGIFLPLITTNCAVLGVAILLVQKEYNLLESVVYSTSTALGFALALVLFAGIRERLELDEVPEAFKGTPIALIVAGILAMAFMGFSGLVENILLTCENRPRRTNLPSGAILLSAASAYLHLPLALVISMRIMAVRWNDFSAYFIPTALCSGEYLSKIISSARMRSCASNFAVAEPCTITLL